MYEAHTTPPEPSLLDTVIRVFEAGQKLILDRLDLAYFDLTQLASRTLRGAVMVLAGALLLAGAWFALLGAVVVWLQQSMSLIASLLVVCGLNVVLGGVAVVVGVRGAQTAAAAATHDLIEDVSESAATAANGAQQS